MPLGFDRLNERTQRPNALINFIKPLLGQDQATSQSFLERIAAQCYPVMKANYITVMSLEEYEPNREFLGRNFNAGEVIQLVLKDRNGKWLGFKFVQMVMMHELAHCKQMNHSRFFWQVRNAYADEMKALWQRKYQGEGLWGRGKDLVTGAVVLERPVEKGDVPEHLCGGTYRRRGRKRKRQGDVGEGQQRLSYAERQQRRIAKKFGVHGEGAVVGDDDLVRGAYEQGKRRVGKPRVANSKRGRDLRAQAALARLEALKSEVKVKEEDGQIKEEPAIKVEPDADSDFDWSDSELGDGDQRQEGEAGMIKVCGDEGEDHEGGQNEWDDLCGIDSKSISKDAEGDAPDDHEDSETESEPEGTVTSILDNKDNATQPASTEQAAQKDEVHQPSASSHHISTRPSTTLGEAASANSATRTDDCPICSLANAPHAPTCMACAHVLRPELLPEHWHCRSETCKGSQYINAGDAGRCGVCGALKPASTQTSSTRKAQAGSAVGMGVISGDVLRWD